MSICLIKEVLWRGEPTLEEREGTLCVEGRSHG